jgi:3-oxoacyl-[acyl-carrier-protein] synthase II
MVIENSCTKDVVVTGVGVVSSVGIGKDAFWNSIRCGKSGISKIESFDSGTYPTQVAGEVRGFDPVEFMSHKEARRMDRSSQMIVAATQMALRDASIDLANEDRGRIGVFTGTAVGGQGWAFREYAVFQEKGLSRINPFTAISTFPNASSAQISGKLGLVGPSVTISSGCVSSSLAVGFAVDYLRLGRIDVAIIGGTEAPLEPGIFGAYCAARVMTTQNDKPSRVPKPFDIRRDGIVLSEGSGVIICESLQHAITRRARVYAKVGGWAHTSDSSNMMMINPDGVQGERALQSAILESGLHPNEIDLVFAHAAGAKMDDKTEVEILRTLLGESLSEIPVTALKSMFGHTQGACGVIESAAAVLSIYEGFVPPTINCESIDPACSILVNRDVPQQKDIKAVLLNNFGFGGKYVAIVFSRLGEQENGPKPRSIHSFRLPNYWND